MMSGNSSCFTGSSCSVRPHGKNSFYTPTMFSVPSHPKAGDMGRRPRMFKMKREAGISKIAWKIDLGTTSLSPPSFRPSSPPIDDEDDNSNSAFTRLAEAVKTIGSKLCITSLVLMALSASNALQPASSFAATGMVRAEAEITQESSPLALSLARHLQSIGAKLYGAFWCSHCVHQKQMFGHEAAKLLNYVECYPDGIEDGAKMADACSRVQLKGFPTWEINGQVYTGEKKFPELARLSGIELE